ncbi:retrovirus-related pol polyprotein from transposon TNT 1-94 [Tanacetum coccineum]
MQLNQEIFQKESFTNNQNALEIPEYFKNNDLKAQLQAKDTTICKLKEHIKSMKENDKEEKVKHEMDEMDTINIELEHIYGKCGFKTSNSRQGFCDTSLKNDLRKLKEKETFENVAQIPIATTIAPGMFKIDIEPLAPMLLNNREAHIDYLKHTQEQADILQGIVKQAKAKQPLDNALDFACSSKKAKIVESKITNNSELNHLWGSNATDVPSSSSLINDSKFLGTVRFGNDQIAKIMGYGDYQLGNVIISRVYYVERIGHNLFFVGQFCNANMEVTFRKNTCFIWNLEGVDLLSGSIDTNLYTISLNDMLKTSLICLLSKASKTKSWLWHRWLSHLKFGTLNKLAKDGLARGIPKLKFQKDHLCSACALGKSKKSSYQPKPEDTNQEKLYLLHMDLCGLMHVESINGKKYILVIVDDYSRFTWVRFLRLKDEAPDAISSASKMFKFNDVLSKRRNQNLVSVAQCDYSKASFLWAKAINTACYTQNRSLIRLRYNKTPYELMHDKKPDLSFLHVFGSLCYPTNDSEDLGKLNAKADIGIFVGYAPAKKAFRIYNRRTRKIMETIHVTFDELTAIASEQFGSGPGLQSMTPLTTSSGLIPNPIPQQPFPVATAPRAVDTTESPVSTLIDLDAPTTNSTSQGSSSNVRPNHTPFEHLGRWIKDHPIANVIGNPSRSVSTRKQLETDIMWCYFDAFLTSVEPKNFKQAMTEPSWIDAIQEEIHEQEEGIDFEESFAPVARIEAIGIFANPSHVYKLKKALYGLKQAPRAWYDMLLSFLISQHFSKGAVDLTLFTRKAGNDLLLEQIYVVDIIFASTNTALCNEFANLMTTKFKMSMMGQIDSVDTPMVEKNKLDADLQETPVDATLYHGMIGSLVSGIRRILKKVDNGIVELYFVPMEYQLADIFTKPFPRERFNFLIKKLGMRSMSLETLKRLSKAEDE